MVANQPGNPQPNRAGHAAICPPLPAGLTQGRDWGTGR